MFRHRPSCLEGPISRTKEWWLSPLAQASKSTNPVRSGPRPAARPLGPDPGSRLELVERVRHEIAAGTYETPEKWTAALERLFEQLGAT